MNRKIRNLFFLALAAMSGILAMPAAATLKLAVSPLVPAKLFGWLVIWAASAMANDPKSMAVVLSARGLSS